ncbi:single-stranded DNA-binding protein, partial [Brevibacillus sp. 179-C9.3 HS]|uniref:single-stranded DNA-binding protein n=1 Tax=unclassified Brevibacillus TaxID=2684853 RepID=UPI00399F1438
NLHVRFGTGEKTEAHMPKFYLLSSNGVAVCKITVAIDRELPGPQGQKETDYLDVIFWRQTAELVANYFKKGRAIQVQGRLQSRSYDNKEGRRVKIWEIIGDKFFFVDSNPIVRADKTGRNDNHNLTGTSVNRGEHVGSKSNDPFAAGNDPFIGEGILINISDDDLPF